MQESCERESSLSDEPVKGSGWERVLLGHRVGVLLVESDRGTRRIVSSLLTQCGYEVSAVSNCAKAWNRLKHSIAKFDLVLVDATLSGGDLLAKITSSEAHKDIPVIMMSSEDSIEVVFKCLQRGAKDFLVKPIRTNELQNLWQHVWRKNHSLSKTGCGSDVEGKKRKAASISYSGDMLSDNFSSSSGIVANNGCEGGSATQVFQQDSKVGPSQGNVKTSCGGANSGPEVSQVPDWEQGTLGRGTHSSLSGSNGNGSVTDKALERSDVAVDLVGTMTKDPSLRRARLTSTAWRAHVVSKFSSSPLLPPQQGIAIRIPSPSEQDSRLDSVGRSTVLNGNECRTSMGVCSEVAVSTESCGSSTLHFPQAVSFQHGKLVEDVTLSASTSGCEESGKQATTAENSRCSLRSFSLKSSAENKPFLFKETPVLNTGKFKSHINSKAHFGALAGSALCVRQTNEKECVLDGDYLGHHPLNSRNNSDAARPNHQQNSCCEGNVCVESSDMDCETTSTTENDGNLHSKPDYAMANRDGSNSESRDKGSSLYDDNPSGDCGNCNSAQGWSIFSGKSFFTIKDSNLTNCQTPAACDGGEVVGSLNTVGDGALHKFRQKRRVQCFVKKVYNHKKLTEQGRHIAHIDVISLAKLTA